MLIWTISDFPAYGNLAGCKVIGKMGYPLCGKNTDSLWLSNIEYESQCILDGHLISAATVISLTEMEKIFSHLAVIQNMALVDPYVE